MSEETVEPVKIRRTRSDKGKPHGPRKVSVPLAFTPASETEAPIHVRLRLKGEADYIEFGCARRSVENGFHVFIYPSERDRWRETRREIAVSEIREIEITEARATWTDARSEMISTFTGTPATPVTIPSKGPMIHSARKSAAATLEALATSQGPIKMDAPPNLTFGDSIG